MNYLSENAVFGKVVAYMYTIEFQKRGLPHAHILLLLDQSHKPRMPDDVNMIVSAEIPDRHQYPELYETVSNCMVHDPCGPLATNSSCMKNGKCSKKFPRDYNDVTILGPDSYPKYRRRDDSAFIIKGNN